MATSHTAIVTGANHGIGAATAQALAQSGYAVLCTFLRVEDAPDAATPQEYRDNRARDAAAVVARITSEGGTAVAVEADLSDPAAPAMLFDTAEAQLGPVDILINNATGWVADTFAASAADRLGRSLQPVTAATWTRQFTVDAMGAALMISEFAQRHIARQANWGRIIGLTSGLRQRLTRFPGDCRLSFHFVFLVCRVLCAQDCSARPKSAFASCHFSAAGPMQGS
jgi:3-oxoacyl-[acyl-carrier protein] reductase